MAHRNLLASKNLDVPETSHDPVTQAAKGSAGDLTLEPLLSVVCPFPAQPNKQREHRGCYRPLGSKYISLPQATTTSRRSNLQNQSASLWLPISPFTGQAPTPGMIPMARASRKFGRV